MKSRDNSDCRWLYSLIFCNRFFGGVGHCASMQVNPQRSRRLLTQHTAYNHEAAYHHSTPSQPHSPAAYKLRQPISVTAKTPSMLS